MLRAEAFNVINHANFGTPNATVFSGTAISPTAGLISSTATTSKNIRFVSESFHRKIGDLDVGVLPVPLRGNAFESQPKRFALSRSER